MITPRLLFIPAILLLTNLLCAKCLSQNFEAIDGTSLQMILNQQAQHGGEVRIQEKAELICSVQESLVHGEISRHALLIPEGVQLDLNSSTLLLDLRSNGHGVRLSNKSAIRNGTIRIVRSENKGSQGIWHSGISIGAPYDDGGTPQKPSYFSRIADWTIEDITIDQPFPASCIQIMSEGCHGIIRRVHIPDSSAALLGIGMDWGSVGKMTTADETIPHMRELWEKQEIYSTHPHDILIEDITIGNLTRNVDANDAGIRCSACYNITIRNVKVSSAASAIAIFGGDCGFEFAPIDRRPHAHTGYRIENVVIDRAFRCGMVLNGLADNVYRSSQTHAYQPQLNTAVPGLNGVVINNCRFHGDRTPQSLGLFVTAVSDVRLQDVTFKDFEVGARIKDWINGLRFSNCRLDQNSTPHSIGNSTAVPMGVMFE
ncbi:MAG: right-handed parallel beta-helix repeat-containing protein [Planctomyces sp.]|nr:right-handed parallel beta-helix repeat-containing protein [Planctomyces sp.]